MSLLRSLKIVIAAELVVCAVLFGLRLNATLPTPPPVDEYTDAITGGEILAVPDRFLFDSAAKWRTLGETYMQARFFAKAEACWHAAAERDPRSADIALWHGCCLEQLGTLEESRKAYLRAAQIGSSRIAELAWYRIGRIHLQLEQSAEATSAFEAAGNNHLPSAYQRAKLLIRGGSAIEAAPLLERLAEDHPRDIHVGQLQALSAEILGHPDEAAVARDTVLRSNQSLQLEEPREAMLPQGEPFGLYPQVARFMQQPRAGGTKFAAEHLLPLVRDETHWQNKIPLLLEEVAEVQLEAGNLSAARTLLEKQIEKRGSPTKRSWETLAQVELAENHPQQAWHDWIRAERLRLNGVDHEKMAQLAHTMGDAAAARRHRGLARQCAGISGFLNDRLEQARDTFRQAVEIDADLPHSWFYLGESERLLGHPGAARAAFERCLNLMPGHGRARAQLLRLGAGK
jgi:tetratricopeptide (TPR) repeat protein